MKRRGVRKAAALLPDDPSRFQIFTWKIIECTDADIRPYSTTATANRVI